MTARRDCEHGHLARSCQLCENTVELTALRAVLDVERNYWQTRSHLARTKTEEVMAEWHLDLIDGALGPCRECGYHAGQHSESCSQEER